MGGEQPSDSLIDLDNIPELKFLSTLTDFEDENNMLDSLAVQLIANIYVMRHLEVDLDSQSHKLLDDSSRIKTLRIANENDFRRAQGQTDREWVHSIIRKNHR
jgi:hypothetical protein